MLPEYGNILNESLRQVMVLQKSVVKKPLPYRVRDARRATPMFRKPE